VSDVAHGWNSCENHGSQGYNYSTVFLFELSENLDKALDIVFENLLVIYTVTKGDVYIYQKLVGMSYPMILFVWLSFR
jgi:hypothetical protein